MSSLLVEKLKRIRNVKKSDDKLTSQKSRVKVYNTIKDALKKGSLGEPFSTTKSNRLYVITKHKWGKDSEQRVGDKVAKGFTPGSAKPGASWKDVKGFAVRTSVRHAKKNAKQLKNKRFFKGGIK